MTKISGVDRLRQLERQWHEDAALHEWQREASIPCGEVVMGRDLYPTPRTVARRMAELLPPITEETIVLEPSCGTGSLIDAVISTTVPGGPKPMIVGCDISEQCAEHCRKLAASWWATIPVQIWCADFLAMDTGRIPSADAVIMNPPFNHGSCIKHVSQALRCLRDGGTLVALMFDGPRQMEFAVDVGAEIVERLPPGTFDRAKWVGSILIKIGGKK